MEKPVPTPCISICKLDENNEYCIGCFRSAKHIGEWKYASNERKKEILAELEENKKKWQKDLQLSPNDEKKES